MWCIGVVSCHSAVFLCGVVSCSSQGFGVEAAGALVGAAEEPRSAIAGALTSVAAIAFAAAWHFGGQPAALPAAPVASAPVTTLIAEGKCKDIQTRFTGKDGTRVELILPPGCTLNPAP